MVPESCDVILSAEEEKALRQLCFTTAPALRREFEPSSKGRKKSPVSWPVLRAKPHDGHKVAIPHQYRKCAQGSVKAQKHSAFSRQGSRNRGGSAKNAAAAGRRDRLPTREQSEAQPFKPAPLSAQAWHLTAASQQDQNHREGEVLRRLKLATSHRHWYEPSVSVLGSFPNEAFGG